MTDRVNLPSDDSSERRTVTDGFFEREVYLSRGETVAFLRELADQLEDGDSFAVSTDDWEIPFAYAEPIEVEIEFTSTHHKELEIELEFAASDDWSGLDVS